MMPITYINNNVYVRVPCYSLVSLSRVQQPKPAVIKALKLSPRIVFSYEYKYRLLIAIPCIYYINWRLGSASVYYINSLGIVIGRFCCICISIYLLGNLVPLEYGQFVRQRE